MLAFASASFASSDSFYAGQVIDLANGKTTIAVTIGEPQANTQELIQRILFLEQAVMDLQAEVYNLRMSQKTLPSNKWECSVEAFGKVYFGKGNSMNQAKNESKKNCLKDNSAMFCEDEDVSCDKL